MALAAPRRRPDADAGALARPGAHRHEPVRRRSCSRATSRSRPPKSTRSSREANEAFPALKLTRADVTLVHRGIVPAVAAATARRSCGRSPAILDHAADGAAGAITVVGVKYTTARAVAERAVSMIAQASRHAPAGRRGPRSPCCPAPASRITKRWRSRPARALALEVPLPIIRHLIAHVRARARRTSSA